MVAAPLYHKNPSFKFASYKGVISITIFKYHTGNIVKFYLREVIAIVLFVCISACGGGGSSSSPASTDEVASNNEVNSNINSYNSRSGARSFSPTMSVVIELENNMELMSTKKLEVEVSVVTDTVPNNSGSEFVIFWNVECDSSPYCEDSDLYRKYTFLDVEGFCCTNFTDLEYAITNEDGHVQFTLEYYGAFTRTTFENLENGQLLYNVTVRAYDEFNRTTLISEDYFPGENVYSDQLGVQFDELRDYAGNFATADIKSIEVTYDLSRYQ